MKIFLIGFMGSGKTHWGKIWADKHELPFFDLDEIIEKKEHRSVLDIFEKNGEDYFRFQESVALRTMDTPDNCIIACGGGAACYADNIDWMNEHGLTVYLHASPNVLLDNIMKEKEKRPLVKHVNEAELLFFIQQKLEDRKPYYEKAKIRMRVEDLSEESFKKIV